MRHRFPIGIGESSLVHAKLVVLLSDILQLEAASLTDELAMQDVESWDSLKHMELIAALEDTYQIQFSFDDIVAMRSVGAIRRVLRDKNAES